jgi:hypothetical protein
LDANGDGRLDDTETGRFAGELLAQAGGFLHLEVDGRRSGPWTVVDVGLGTPLATGGSFSVDLALEAPLSATGDEHAVWLEDLWPLPNPGETEVRVEAAPGVELIESHPRRDGSGLLVHYAYQGGPASPGERGLWIRFRGRGAEALPPPPTEGRSSTTLYLALALIPVGIGLGLLLRRKAQRKMNG